MTMEPDQPEPADEGQDLPAMDLARIRHSLMRRLNASPTPSRFINDLHAAHGRCNESGRQLRRIMYHHHESSGWCVECCVSISAWTPTPCGSPSQHCPASLAGWTA